MRIKNLPRERMIACIIIAFLLIFPCPSFAQDISQEAINRRIQQLEQEKIRLEEIYREILVRIDEIKKLLQPQENKNQMIPQSEKKE